MSTTPRRATVDVSAISIEPEDACPIDSELKLGVDFEIDADVARARWVLQYTADHAHRRHVVDLGAVEMGGLEKGTHRFEHSIHDFGVSGLSEAVVLNVGLLTLTLHDGPSELLQISMVVQVLEQDDQILRVVLNPME
jgi:hypothetical protein